MAAGLHKNAKKLVPPDANLDEDTENDLFGIFYNVLANFLRGNPCFTQLIVSRTKDPEYQKFMDNIPIRAPRKSESRSGGDAEVIPF